MQNQYNLHGFEASFKKYLLAGKLLPITLKNYLSDLRHFLGWLITIKKLHNPQIIIANLNESIVNEYKEYLKQNSIPVLTINRRLSTIRKFGGFCFKAGWIKENYARYVANISTAESNVIARSVSDEAIPLKSNPSVTGLPRFARCSPVPGFARNDINFSHSCEGGLQSRANIAEGNLISNKRLLFNWIPAYAGMTALIKRYMPHVVSYMLIFLALTAAFFYLKSTSAKQAPLIMASAKSADKTLLFSGKLTDSLGNPLDDKTDVVFRLYDASENGSSLYTGSCTGVDSVTPDTDGVISVLLGQDCGMKKIPNELFSGTDLYLGIAVGTDAEMTPRQKIATVNYALSADNIQGLSLGKSASTIPYLNNNGDLLLADLSPAIRSTYESANFTITSAKSLTIQSAGTGDITLSATESGSLNFQTGNSTKMYVGNEGRVGIGTTSPVSKLDVVSEASGSAMSIFTQGLFAGDKVQLALFSAPGISGTDPLNVAELRAATNGFDSKNSFLSLNPINTNGANFVTGLSLRSGGNIGIGTTNPLAKLMLVSSGNVGGFTFRTQDSSGTDRFAILDNGNIGIGNTNPGYLFTVGNNLFTVNSSGYTTLPRGSASSPSLSFTSDTNTGLWSRTDNELNFSTDGTERIRITNNGNVGIGTTNPTAQLELSGSTAIKSSGTTWANPSDARLKNIVGNYTYGLDEILQINPVRFIFKQDNGLGIEDPDEHIGIIAQEMQKVIPESVSVGDRGFLKFNLDPVIWASINAIKELGTWNLELSSELHSLEQITTSLSSQALDNLQNQVIIASANVQNLTNTFFTKSLNAVDATIEKLTVEQKIITPIVETKDLIATGVAKLNQVETNIIKPQSKDIVIDLGSEPPAPSEAEGEVGGQLSALIIKGIKEKTVTTIDSSGNINTEGGITAQTATISGSLTADNVQTSTMSAHTASVSGTLTAQEVKAENIDELSSTVNRQSTDINEIQKLLADIKNEPLPNTQYSQNITQNIPVTLNGSSSAQISSLIRENPLTQTDNNTQDQNNSNLLAQNVQTISDPVEQWSNVTASNAAGAMEQLIVTGNTNLYNLAVVNSLSAGNLLIQDNSILSLSWELKLNALSRINLLDGDVVIAKGGNLTTKGTLIAQAGVQTTQLNIKNANNDTVASINTLGQASFNQVTTKELSIDKYLDASSGAIIAAPDNFQKNGVFAPAVEVGTKTAGNGLLPANQTEVVIYSEKVTDNSLVYITPTSKTSGSLFVAEKNTCSQSTNDTGCKKYFKVAVNNPSDQEVRFNWWVVN